MQFKLRDYQQKASDAAVSFFNNKAKKTNAIMVLPTGCHAKGSKILMYDGSIKNVEDVKVGDELVGDDGNKRTVLELHRGVDKLYEIIPIKGEPFVVNGGHILSLYKTNEGKSYPSCTSRIDKITVEDYLSTSNNYKHLHKLYKPKSVSFGRNDVLPIDPYFLGLYLGDGSSACGGVNITSMRKEVEEYLYSFVKENELSITENWKGGSNKAKTYNIVGLKWRTNTIIDFLKDRNLYGVTCSFKFIPLEYKAASEKDRLSLLAGLMDTDSHYAKDRNEYEYCTKSGQLADDIIFLCRSLGFYCSTKKQKIVNGEVYYRLIITGELDTIPTKVQIRKGKPRAQKKSVLVTGFSVKYLGRGNYYGFTIDGNHLYCDGQFFVHHNSGKSLIIADIANRLDGHTLVFQPSKEILEQNFKKLCSYGVLDCSIYSASFNSKEISRITFATIGSVKAHPELFLHFRNVIVDECFTGETEILTEKGFVRFDGLGKDLKVAQFDNGTISFVNPIRHIQRHHDGNMTSFHIKDGIDVPMTDGHMQVFWKEGFGYFKEEISKAYFGNKRKIPVSGMSNLESNELSDLERLYIAVQADGSIHKRYDGYVTISFSLKKERKISRLRQLCESANIPISEVKCTHARRFMVKMPEGATKDISNHITFPMSSKKAMEVIKECVLWDGSVLNDKGLCYYSSTDKKQVDFYNAVASISGNSCYVSYQIDKRSKEYNTVYRLFIRTHMQLKDTQQMKKQPNYYKGYVYCVEVPSGAIVVRHKGYTFISGNCHLVNPKEGMYKTFFEIVNCKVLGLTATPYRLSSSRNFGSMLKFITRTKPHVFYDVIYHVQVSTLLDMGYLAKLNYYPMNPIGWNELNLKTNTTGADYTDKSVQKEYERIDFYGYLVHIVQRLMNPIQGGKRKGILVFTRFLKEAERLTWSIPGCVIVSGDTPKGERERILKAFKSGEIPVVANVGVLVCGFDYPELDTVVMARPTMSLAMWYQIVGRAIRPHPDKETGWVVDLAGNINRFGKVEDLKLVDGGNGKWAVYSKSRQLTNVYF